MNTETLTGYQLATKLFEIHSHGELCKPEEIVYKEKDIVRLLISLGFPKPDFEQLAKVSRFWKGDIPKN